MAMPQIVMNPSNQIISRLGLDTTGAIQKFHTQNCLRRIVKYMPYRSGATIKLTIAQTDISKPVILVNVPYAKYLYYGKAMTGSAPKSVTDKDLNYTKTKNPQAGPFWDRRLVAAEKAVLTAELQAFINRRAL